MKTLILTIFLIITHGCSDEVTIEGCWISKDDNHYSLKIRKNTLEEIYDTETSSFIYKRSNISCDKDYLNEKSNKELEFISLDDGRCFEILNLTKSIFILRHTTSGNILSFYKTKNPDSSDFQSVPKK